MSELDSLAIKYGTDKSSIYHGYTKYYESYLKDWKERNVVVIELGTGGYEYADRGGESARMWYSYFINGKIISMDIFQKEGIINDRTEFWQGSQTDKHLLKTIIGRELDKEIRIVIDDASHHNIRTIESFRIIFPLLKSGDLYIVEDVHTSYYQNEEYEGKNKPGAVSTTMGFFTGLCHPLNWETLVPEFRNEYAGKLEVIHFYKEILVIKKL